MADALDSETLPQLETPTQHGILHGLVSPVHQKVEHLSKFSFCFVSRTISILVIAFLILLFPAKPPPFVNHTFDTRIWELLKLLFVGIAVSYGVLGRRHVVQSDNEHNNVGKSFQDSAFSVDQPELPSSFSETNLITEDSGIVTRSRPQLPVRSLKEVALGEEAETSVGQNNDTNFKTWNNQYFHAQPVVVSSEDSGILTGSLKVGSAFEEEGEAYVDRSTEFSDNVNGSDRGVEGFANSTDRMVSGGAGEMENANLEKIGIAGFCSAITWGSNYRGMSMENGYGTASLPPFSCSSAFLVESGSEAAAKIFPSSSSLQEFVGMGSDGSVEENEFSWFPPLPTTSLGSMNHQSQATASSCLVGEAHTSKECEAEGTELNRSSEESLRNASDLVWESLRRETREKHYNEGQVRSKSDLFDQDLGNRCFRSGLRSKLNKEVSVMGRSDWGGNDVGNQVVGRSDWEGNNLGSQVVGGSDWEGKDLGNQPLELETRPTYCKKEAGADASKKLGTKPGMLEGKLKDCRKRSSKAKLYDKSLSTKYTSLATQIKQVSGGSYIGKAVRTRRTKKGDGIVTDDGKRYREVEAVMVKKSEVHIEHVQPQQKKIEKPSRKFHHKLGEKEKATLEDNNVIFENLTDGKEAATSTYVIHSSMEKNEVDKKADEFIAKFREQIRLQKVESTRKSNRKHTDTNLK